jgi:predicted Fe-Mo cluster-binding NifX family protein
MGYLRTQLPDPALPCLVAQWRREHPGEQIPDGQVFTVAWGTLHDQGTEGAHHARVARFLRDNQVEAVAVCHVGSGMQRMLDSMAIRVVTGPGGDAHSAALAAG